MDLDGGTKKHILYIPGTSGLKDMSRINQLGIKAQEAGFNFSFLKAWDSDVDLQSKTLSHILDSIDSTIETLVADKYEIYVVAKSFGGGLMLLRDWSPISKMVLWAPAIGLSGKNSLDAIKDTALKDLVSMFDIATDIATLNQITAPTLVIRGTEDNEIQLSTLQSITKNLPCGEFRELQGMGHSPKTKEELEFLLADTIQFLKTE